MASVTGYYMSNKFYERVAAWDKVYSVVIINHTITQTKLILSIS